MLALWKSKSPQPKGRPPGFGVSHPKGATRAHPRLEMNQQDCFDCAHYPRQKQNNEGTKWKNAPAQAYVLACVILAMLRK